jgi:hypothetical protein
VIDRAFTKAEARYIPNGRRGTTNMRATFLAGGKAIDRSTVRARSIDLAATAAFLLDVPAPERSQGVVLRRLLDDRWYTPVSIIRLNDFHGQVDQTTTMDGRTVTVGGGAPGPADTRAVRTDYSRADRES